MSREYFIAIRTAKSNEERERIHADYMRALDEFTGDKATTCPVCFGGTKHRLQDDCPEGIPSSEPSAP